jgi:hypothetical protein
MEHHLVGHCCQHTRSLNSTNAHQGCNCSSNMLWRFEVVVDLPACGDSLI